MAVAIADQKRGRPCFVPRVKGIHDRQLQFYDAFYEVCSTFRYREIAGWARFLGVHTFTVERWKYGMSFPRRDAIAQQIIDWDRNGRPWGQAPSGQSASNML